MQPFDVQAFIDRQKLRPVHIAVLTMIALVMFIDGFDIFMVGKIAPAIAEGFDVTPARMTEVFLLQQLGLAVGAFVISPLSDFFGRKRMLIISSIIFGVITTATVFATSITMLAVLRGLSGLFLAGVLPTAVALLAEFTPKKTRSTFIAIGMAGYSLGSTAGAGVALLVPEYGWHSGFWIGGLLPLIIVPLLWFWLPESLSYRVGRNANDPAIPKIIARIDPTIKLTGTETFILPETTKGNTQKTKLLDIFREGRSRTTTLLFSCCVFSMGNIALLAAWLPTFFQEMGGITIQRFALVSIVAFQGGLVGTLTIGVLMDRVRPVRLIPLYYVGNACALLLLSHVPFGTPGFMLLLMFWSFCQTGGQSGLNMLAAQLYPTSIRSTALGWSGGAGRLGSVVTPLFGGFALASAFSLQLTLSVIAIAPMIVAGLILLLRPIPKASSES